MAAPAPAPMATVDRFELTPGERDELEMMTKEGYDHREALPEDKFPILCNIKRALGNNAISRVIALYDTSTRSDTPKIPAPGTAAKRRRAINIANDYEDTFARVVVSKDGRVPVRANNYAAGIDIFAYQAVMLLPNIPTRVDVGFQMKPPSGFHWELKERSSVALLGISLGAGVIDQDYTGPISAVLTNYKTEPYQIVVGAKIAQAVARRDTATPIKIVKALPKTHRGDRGFGSTDTEALEDEPATPFNMFTGETANHAAFYEYDAEMDAVAIDVFGEVPKPSDLLYFSKTYAEVKLECKDRIYDNHTKNWLCLGYRSREHAKYSAMVLISKQLQTTTSLKGHARDEFNEWSDDPNMVVWSRTPRVDSDDD